MHNWRVVISILLGIAAVAAIAIGVIYVTVPMHSLPSFIPGHTSGSGHSSLKHAKRGYAGIGVGVVLLVVAIAVTLSGRRRRSW
jgi:hypothetical protein